MKLSSSVMRRQNGKNYSIFLPNKWRTDMPKNKYSSHPKNFTSKKKIHLSKNIPQAGIFIIIFIF